MRCRIGAGGEEAAQSAQSGPAQEVQGARTRTGRPTLPAAVGQVKSSATGATEDETEVSEASRYLLKQ